MNQIEAKKQKIAYYSYIVGLVSFILLGYLIGNNGVTYMAVIIECVSFFVLAINGSSADMISRLIRSRRKKSQYKEAGELHKTVLLIQTIMAVILMIAYFFLTDVLSDVVFGLPFLAVAMKLLTPVILLKTLQCAMLGYFQGQGSHMPTVVCSVFRQLLFLLFSLLFTGRLVNYGTKVSALLNNPDYAGMYGAFGLCLAMLISEIFISIFLLIVYVGSDRSNERKKSKDGLQKMDSFSDRCRLVLLVSLPEAAKEILKKLPFALGLFFVLWKSEDISATAHSYGLFFGCFVCVCAIPVFLISARMLNISGKLTALVKRKDKRSIREAIYAGLHYCWAVGLYTSVCLVVLAPQIGKLLYKESAEMLQQYYTYGAAMVAVLVLNIFLMRVLFIMESHVLTNILLVIFNVVFVISNLILKNREMDSILVLCLAALIAGMVQLILSFLYVVRKYVLQPDMIKGFLMPIVAVGVMGLVVILIQNILSPHVSSLVCLLLCLMVSVIVYLAVLVLAGSINETKISYAYGALGRKIFGMIIR